MNETFNAKSGLSRVTRLNPRVRSRLIFLILAFGAGTFLILWINQRIGRQMDRLQNEFAVIKSERFYAAVHMRSAVRKLNSTLLGFHLGRQEADRETFRKESIELKTWLETRQPQAITAHERELFRQLQSAYDQYLQGMEQILEAIDQEPQRAAFAGIYEQVRQETRPLLDLFEKLVQVQRETFDLFFVDSRDTMIQLHRLLALSLWLLLALTISLAVLVYRIMIAPLRRELDESRVIIERQEKMASLGLLAAGVAHEIRNPLTAIKFRLFSLKKSLPPELSDLEDARVIEGEIQRLERIVKEFLQFARPSDPELARVSAGQILQEVYDLMAVQLEKTAIHLQWEPASTAWVHADIQQIKQVLINLIQNSADSIERNGSIRLSLQTTTTELDGRVRPAAVLQVADTGKGIPSEVEKWIFDPFFSTKDGGTGLGLAIATRIVTKHGGQLRHQTQLNCGTTFEIVLPKLEDHATENPHR